MADQQIHTTTDTGQAAQPEQVPVDPEGYKQVRAETIPSSEVEVQGPGEGGPPDPNAFNVREESFRMREKIGAAVLLDLAVVGDKSTPQIEQLRAMRTFLDQSVNPDDRAALHQYLRAAEPPIEFEELGEVIEKMVEKISNRPTERQSDSPT